MLTTVWDRILPSQFALPEALSLGVSFECWGGPFVGIGERGCVGVKADANCEENNI